MTSQLAETIALVMFPFVVLAAIGYFAFILHIYIYERLSFVTGNHLYTESSTSSPNRVGYEHDVDEDDQDALLSLDFSG
jgi:hypothetical protein